MNGRGTVLYKAKMVVGEERYIAREELWHDGGVESSYRSFVG